MTIGYDGLPPSYIGKGSPLTPNLGLSLSGMDPVIAENFVLIDAAGSSVQINGTTIANPNFNNTTPAAPANSVNVTWQVSGSSVSAYVPNTTPANPANSIQFNNGGAFGGSANLTWDNTNFIVSETHNSIGNTTADGILLTNTTAAVSGGSVQSTTGCQFSPALHFIGQSWKSNATAASQQVEIVIDNEPTVGTTIGVANLVIKGIINGVSTPIAYFACAGQTGGLNGSIGAGLFGLDGSQTGYGNNIGISGFGAVNGVNVFGVFNNSANIESFSVNGIGFGSGRMLYWTSASQPGNNTTGDTGLSRIGAGILGAGNGTVGDTTGKLQLGSISKYNSINTVSNGIPTEYAQVNLTAQGANVAATTIYAVPSTGAGLYRVTVFIVVSRAGTTSTMPDSRIIYTDRDGGTSVTRPATGGDSGNAVSTTFATNTFVVNAAASTNIQYDIGQVTAYASTGGTTMQFAYHAIVEAL